MSETPTQAIQRAREMLAARRRHPSGKALHAPTAPAVAQEAPAAPLGVQPPAGDLYDVAIRHRDADATHPGVSAVHYQLAETAYAIASGDLGPLLEDMSEGHERAKPESGLCRDGLRPSVKGELWRTTDELQLGMHVRAVAHCDNVERWYRVTAIEELSDCRRVRLGDGRPVELERATEVLTRRLYAS